MADGLEAAAIDRIKILAQEAQQQRWVKVDKWVDESHLIIYPDGRREVVEARPKRHSEKLATPAELGAFVRDLPDNSAGVLFYSFDQVVYCYDRNDRRDTAACRLDLSPQFRWLSTESQQPLNQAGIVRVLRIVFRGCLSRYTELLGLLRQLKFTAGGQTEADLQHARESMGKSIQAAVTGISALPEELVLHVPVYENHPFTVDVDCALEVFPAEQAFKLTPYPLELRRARDAAMSSIQDMLTGPGLPPAYEGQP